MQIYQTDELGLWDGNTDKFARPDLMVPGEFLMPGGRSARDGRCALPTTF